MDFIKWFCDNWYANCFTIITVVLSGIISLAISAVYYRKGNRNNLKMAVIHPIIRLLEEAYTRQNYNILCDISKEYSVRYMSKNEAKKLTLLLSAYKEVSSYNDIYVSANILFSYFEYTLKKNNIEVKPVPFEHEGEIIYYDYPPDLHYLSNDLERLLNKIEPELQPDEFKEAVIELYEHYCKEYYTSEKIEYFEDYTIKEVMSKSKIRQKWNEKFDDAQKAKEQFLSLKIVRDN
jgi:hypothetical protein